MRKITKVLSLFIIVGAISAGVIGAAGCSKKGGGSSGGNNGNSGSEPVHIHTYAYTDNEDGATHRAECNDADCDNSAGKVIENQAHQGTDECTLCHGAIYDPSKAESITVTSRSAVKIGAQLTLTATVAPSTASQEVEWSIVEGEEYATLDGNQLTGVAAGNVTVKAIWMGTSANVSETATITVEELTRYDELVADKANNIIGMDFDEETVGTKLSAYTGYENNAVGLYVWGDGSPAANEDCYAEVISDGNGGKLKHRTDNTNNVSIVADIGSKVQNKDIVEGYVDLSISALGSDWAFMALTGKSNAVADTNEVFAIVCNDENGTIGYRVGGKTAGKTVNSAIRFSVNTDYTIHYTLNMVTGLISVDITPPDSEQAVLCEDVLTGIAELKAVTFVSGDEGKSLTAIDNLAINSKEATLN